MLAKKTRKILSLALVIIMVISMFPMMAMAEEGTPPVGDPLQPASLKYEGGKIELSKTAVRTGADEWEITVQAKIGNITIQQQPLEVVFVLDRSGSMAWCTAEEHQSHTSECYGYLPEDVEHTHGDACYSCVKTEHTHTVDCYNCDKTAHTHTEDCYACGQSHTHDANCCSEEPHTHTIFGCGWILTWLCGKSEHSHDGISCKYSGCDKEHTHSEACGYIDEEHTHSEACGYKDEVHIHSEAECGLNCPQNEHTHTPDCLKLVCTKTLHTHSTSGGSACKSVPAGEGQRLAAAVSAINGMADPLKDAGARIRYVTFSNSASNVLDNLGSVSASGSTNLIDGVNKAINNGFSGSSAATRVLIVVTDGEANLPNSAGSASNYTSPDLTTFKSNGGIVYTIGFTHDDANLAGMANGGYFSASNLPSLNSYLESVAATISAMIVDPMGPTVDYVAGSLNNVSGESLGYAEYADGKVTWTPETNSLNSKTVTFTYKVKLNSSADMSAGVHSNVALNNTTYLQYAIDKVAKPNANFPLPKATYEVATLTTSWVKDTGGADLQTPTLQKKISDWYLTGTSGDKGAIFDIDIPATLVENRVNWYYEDSAYDSGTPGTMTSGTKTITDNLVHTLVNTYSEEPPAPTYTTSYDWGNSYPVSETIPTDGSGFDSEEEAVASKDTTYTDATVLYDATGKWEFSGWTQGTTANYNVPFTGTWTFTPAIEEDGNSASFTVKKVDENGADLAGATFELTLLDNDGDPTSTVFTPDASGAGLNEYDFFGLKEGDYTLTEIAPEGYTAAGPWTVEITEDGNPTITGPSEATGNVITTIWNWLVKVFTGEEEITEEAVWNSNSNTLTVANIRDYGWLTISKEFVGLTEDQFSDIEISVDIAGPADFDGDGRLTVVLNEENGWTWSEYVPTGDYTVGEQTGTAGVSGYSLAVSYDSNDDTAVQGTNNITVPVGKTDEAAPTTGLEDELYGALVEITNTYRQDVYPTSYSLTVNHIGVAADGTRTTLGTTTTPGYSLGQNYTSSVGSFTGWTFTGMDVGSAAVSGTINGNTVVTYLYESDTDIPEETDPLGDGVDIPDETDPLGDGIDIPDDLDPLGDAPKTSDSNNVFALLAIMISCAFGLVIINLPRKKRNEA